MNLLNRKQKKPLQAQLRDGGREPFGFLGSYRPLSGGDTRLYRAIREAVPIVDAAVMKIVRLTGGFHAQCGDKAAERELNRFIRTVNVGRGQVGLQSFLDSYLDSMLTSGRAVGEIVTRGGREIAAVVCGNVDTVSVREGDTPLTFQLGRYEGGRFKPFPYQDLLLFTPYNPDTDSPYGVSMMRSMPYMTEILLKIYDSIGHNFERCGNVRYAVVCKNQGDALDKVTAERRAAQIAKQWSEAMKSGKNGSIRDFVALGDVDIRTIGADNQMPDTQGPTRQILEQLVSKTGVPPFLLGLTWASTERMSSQQADLMTSELAALRRSLDPVLERICSLWLRLYGCAADFEIVWDDINLQDETEDAKAQLYRAQAEAIKTEDRGESIEPEVT